jgi:HK97 family phage prohead protease
MSGTIRKEFSAETRAVGDRTVEFILSTEDADREKDVVTAAGWRLDAYKRNPVVLWAHRYADLPVARAVDVRVLGKKLVARAEFAPASIYPFAQTVFAMLQAGYLNAVSVGFRPLKSAQNAQRGGVDFLEQELLEFSVVPVPAHQGALVVGRGADERAVKAWLAGDDDEVVLEVEDAQPTYSLDQIAAAYAALGHGARRRHTEPFEPVCDVSPSEVRALIGEALREGLGSIVRESTVAAVAKLRGRVD